MTANKQRNAKKSTANFAARRTAFTPGWDNKRGGGWLPVAS
jgi:hypothetical protein